MGDDSTSTERNNDSREPSPPPAGPTDHGGKGGMATREVAPDIAEPDDTDPPE
jgi:hypothetical protein